MFDRVLNTSLYWIITQETSSIHPSVSKNFPHYSRVLIALKDVLVCFFWERDFDLVLQILIKFLYKILIQILCLRFKL